VSSIAERVNAAPWYQLLGMQASSEADGTARVSLPFHEKLTQLYGAIHGGVLLTLADSAICVALGTLLDEDELIATVQLSLEFLAPAGQSDLIAEGTVTKRGKTLAFGECVIRGGDRELARGHAVCHVGRRAPQDPCPAGSGR
jgi:acyl-CoA thioesterase